MDSCGDLEEILESCACGCTEDLAACQSPCECDEGLLDCGSGCIDPDSDTDHCGGCNQPCDESQTCENGQCALGGDCPWVNLTSDGLLDLDIQTVRVIGQITLEGASLPTEELGRGQLVFIESLTGSQVLVELETSGAKSYGLTLAPGIYHVDYLGNPALCTKSGTAFPCNSGRLLSGLVLQNDGVLDVTIPRVHVSGQVSLKGATSPSENADRGSLVFSLLGGGQASKEAFGQSGAFSYALTLLPGAYDLHSQGNPGLCVGNSPSAMPCNAGVLLSDLNLQNDGALDVDIPAVRVQGQVTLEGAAMSTEASDRGQLGFQLRDGITISGRSFGTSGSVAYDLRLLPGNYLVIHQANEGLCSSGMEEPQVPCTDQILLGCGGN